MSDAGLRFLAEAVRAGSIRAAADQMDMAASSVSRQIAMLEQRHGIALIEKGRRGIRLTHAGEIVMEHYRHLIAEGEALRAKLEDLRAVRSGVVNIAVGEGFLNRSFTDTIRTFQHEYRDIQLNIKVGSSQDIARLVVDDEAHMGLVFQIPHDPKIQVRSAVAQPLMVIVPRGHALAGRGKLSIADLKGYPLCLTEQSFRLRQIVSDAEAIGGHHLEPTLITNSISVMLEMVRSGAAMTILPAVSVWVELQHGSMIAIPLAEDRMNDTSISLILRSGRRLEGAPARLLGALDRLIRQWSQSLPKRGPMP